MVAAIDEQMAELAAKGIRIPPQPEVLVRLRQLLERDDYDVRGVAAVIATDPGMAALLFRTAASPAFARGKRLETLEQVVAVVGAKPTFNLVQALALIGSMSGRSREAFEVFWTRSQDIARLAALIAADRISVCNIFPDQAYMAGLFHGCGVPVLMQRFPDYARVFDMGRGYDWPDIAEEDARFNVDHCAIGYLVARHWRLPDFVCNALRYAHVLPDEEVGTTRTLVAIILLATNHFQRISTAADPHWPAQRKGVLDELGIAGDGEQEYFEEISEQFHGNGRGVRT